MALVHKTAQTDIYTAILHMKYDFYYVYITEVICAVYLGSDDINYK